MKIIKIRYIIIAIAILTVALVVTGILIPMKNKKERAYLISISNKLFNEHMDKLINVPEKENIQSSYTITNTKIIAGDKREFVVDINYDLVATILNDTEFVHMKWTMRIKKSSSDKYSVIDQGAWVKTDGLKLVKNPPQAPIKKSSVTKMSLNSSNKYSIRGSRISVTYDDGKKWVDVPVPMEELLNESELVNFTKTNDTDLEEGSFYITPKITAFIYGANLGQNVEPLKVIITDNQGKSWYTVNISAKDSEFGYARKFISFTSAKQGYIVLTSSVAMGHQENNIYKTNDGGKTWEEIGNTNKVYARVVTGAGFANDKIGFMGFRYESDNNPTVYRTADSGNTWEKLNIKLPSKYLNDYATPLCPVFKGANGLLPVKLKDSDKTIQFTTNDYGQTWRFDKEVVYSSKKK